MRRYIDSRHSIINTKLYFDDEKEENIKLFYFIRVSIYVNFFTFLNNGKVFHFTSINIIYVIQYKMKAVYLNEFMKNRRFLLFLKITLCTPSHYKFESTKHLNIHVSIFCLHFLIPLLNFSQFKRST